MNKKTLASFFPEREKGKYCRKYDFGLVLIIGGGYFYSGSPALSALAAYQVGADMTRILAPRRAADIIASFSPEMATYPLEGQYLDETHLPLLLAQTESAKTVSRGNLCVVIGGGTGRSEETKKAILAYLKELDVPAVIDADALHALPDNPEIVSGRPFLLTPHTYEFFILTKKEVYRLDSSQQQEIVREEAARLKTTIILKGNPDIISDGEKIILDTAGSPYMSVGGTGDVLAGVCGALMARGIDPMTAADISSYLVGKAGERAAAKHKEGMLPTHVIAEIASAIHQ